MHSSGQTGEMDPNHCYWGSKLPQPSGGAVCCYNSYFKYAYPLPTSYSTSKNLSWRNNGTDSHKCVYLDIHYNIFIMTKIRKNLNIQLIGLAK